MRKKNKVTLNRSVDEKLKGALGSIGVEAAAQQKLLSSSRLRRAVVPIYTKSGLTPDSHTFWLIRLPKFLEWLEDEFPNGQVSWDSDYEGGEPGTHQFAIHVTFNLLEDDQGARRSIRPTGLEEEMYHKVLDKLSYKREDAIQVHEILHAH
jgi:hypothetical protein